LKGEKTMGDWIFGLLVGILICGLLPSEGMITFHNFVMKTVTLGKTKIKEKFKKE
jgi:hypothetical protein